MPHSVSACAPAAVGAVLVMAAGVHGAGPVTFQELALLPGAFWGVPWDVGGNGTAVGHCLFPSPVDPRGCRWIGGVPQLLTVPVGFAGTVANGTSEDGFFVVGSGVAGVSERAVRWVGNTPFQLGVLPGALQSTAHAVSDDGQVVTGISNPNQFTRAFRWTAQTGMVNLGTLPGASTSWAETVSRDGSTIIGYCTFGLTDPTAFRWTAGTGMVSLGQLPGSTEVYPSDTNVDGSVIVGTGFAGNSPQAFRWTEATGMVPLGLPPGATGSGATAVSADGRVIVGGVNFAGGVNRLYYWTDGVGADLETTLAGVIPAGWDLSTVTAISADGLTLCGSAIVDGQFRGWTATVPAPGVPLMLVAGLAAARRRRLSACRV